MKVTVAIALVFCLFAGLEVFDKIPKKYQRIAEIGVLLVSAFLSCTRYAPMGDYYTYERTYEIMHTADFWHLWQVHNVFQFEAGYYGLMFVCRLLGLSFPMFIAVEGIFTNVGLYLAAKDFTKQIGEREEGYPILVFFLMWCFGLFQVIVVRQTLAVLLCYGSLWFVRKKKPIGFVLCTFAAFLFHRSSLLWICAYPLYWLPSHTKKEKMLVLGVWLLGLFGAFLSLRCLPGILPGTIGEKLRWYLMSESAGSGIRGMLKSNANLILLSVVFTAMLQSQKSQRYHGLYHLYLFGAIFMVLSNFYGEIFGRFATPFNMLSVFLLSENLIRFTGKKKAVFYGCLSVYALFRLYSFVRGSAMDPVFETIFPYL